VGEGATVRGGGRGSSLHPASGVAATAAVIAAHRVVSNNDLIHPW
jgi:hypothetical protein